MRVLHPVRPEEDLVARGAYRYFSADKPTGDIETWLITRLPDGTEITRSDIDGENGSGGHLITHFRRNVDGSPEWLRIRYRKGNMNAAAQYTFEKASVRIARQISGYNRQIELLEIAANYVVEHPSMIAREYVWRGYPDDAEGEGRSIPVFSPDLWALGGEALKGRALRYHISPLNDSPCATLSGEYAQTRHFSMTLNDGEEALVWYDAAGVPLRLIYPNQGFDFNLTVYQRG